MASVGIVIESTADLSPAWLERFGVAMVPLVVNWDGQTYRDKLDLTTADFYRRLRTSKTLPKTGAPSAASFEAAFRAQLKEHDAVISINLASRLSGTFDVARKAAESVDPQRVSVIDSGSVSICIGWLAEQAATLARQGLSPAEIVEQANQTKSRLRNVARGSSAWASSLPAELLETGARIFRAEAQDGYRDRIVIGGLAGFASNLGIERVSQLLDDYARLLPSEREARLSLAQTLLNG